MDRTVDDLIRLMKSEVAKMRNDSIRAAFSAFVIEPELHYRNWDFGTASEAYPCWLIAKFPDSDLGIAYSEYGHGRTDPWGVVSLSRNCFGGDDYWFLSLEDAFLQSGFWHGPIPEGYEVS